MTYLTLSALQEENSSTGYSLIKIIKSRTNGFIELKVGTIYALLDVLVDKNYLSREDQVIRRKSKDGYKRMTVYTLTIEGKEELQLLRDKWRDFVSEVSRFEEAG
ncbi:MAG: PadR family transcriptional regulator [Candidatus Hodarchaeales archaeon]|jgi:DNA-binding PadR family transcriptional regulator